MKAFVTGGAGFIGSHLVDRLVELGAEVWVLDDLSNGFRENVNPEAYFAEASVGKSLCVKANIEACKPDVVFHLAARGSVPFSIAHPEITFDSNDYGTFNVLRAAEQVGVKRFVFASSASYYGDGDGMASEFGPLPKFESQPPAPLNAYAVSKVAGEMRGMVFNNLHDLPFVALRFFNVFGPRQRADSDYAAVVPKFIDRAFKGEPLELHGGGVQTRDLTYVDNVVDALVAVAQADARVAGQAFNVCAGDRVSIKDLATEISIHALGGYSDQYDGVPAKLRLKATPPRPGDIRDSFGDNTKLNQTTGWEPKIDWREGVRLTVEWFRKQQ